VNGEVVDGGGPRASNGACPVGSGCGGDAQRVARGSGGGVEREDGAWPELAVDAPTTSTASTRARQFRRGSSFTSTLEELGWGRDAWWRVWAPGPEVESKGERGSTAWPAWCVHGHG
jgi:hypothetical protein